jgi:fructose/tagatose bisphosphate aldolase
MTGGIWSGMTRINFSGHLNGLFTQNLRRFLVENPDVVDPRKCVTAAYEAVKIEVEGLLLLYASLWKRHCA